MNNHDPFDDENSDDEIQDDAPLYDGPSKSQLKRDAEDLQKLGRDLIALKASELDQFELPENLHKAILDAHHITSHGALRRQHQYIGKFMRHVDADAVRAKFDALRQKHEVNSAHFKTLEHWRDRILSEGNKAIDELLQLHPHADRQLLRQLQRNSLKEKETNKPPAAARQLFKYLRSL